MVPTVPPKWFGSAVCSTTYIFINLSIFDFFSSFSLVINSFTIYLSIFLLSIYLSSYCLSIYLSTYPSIYFQEVGSGGSAMSRSEGERSDSRQSRKDSYETSKTKSLKAQLKVDRQIDRQIVRKIDRQVVKELITRKKKKKSYLKIVVRG